MVHKFQALSFDWKRPELARSENDQKIVPRVEATSTSLVRRTGRLARPKSNLECDVGLKSAWPLNRVTGGKQEMVGRAEIEDSANIELGIRGRTLFHCCFVENFCAQG